MRRHEAADKFQALGEFLANLFRLRRTHRLLELFVELVELDLAQKFLDRFRAHPGREILAILFLRFAIFDFVQELRLLQRRLARIDDDVVLIIDDALELPRAHVEHQADARRHALVKPDVRNGDRELDVAHTFTANARKRDFNAATIADNALVLDSLVFSARTFPVACRTENSFAEKSALLRLERSIIDRLRIFDFAFAPRPHRVARSHANRDLVETDRSLFSH